MAGLAVAHKQIVSTHSLILSLIDV